MNDTKKELKKGDFVTWSSQSHGNWRRKVGYVLEVVKPNTNPTKAPAGSGDARDHWSYVVRVMSSAVFDESRLKTVGKFKKDKLVCWPRTGKLSRASEDDKEQIVQLYA